MSRLADSLLRTGHAYFEVYCVSGISARRLGDNASALADYEWAMAAFDNGLYDPAFVSDGVVAFRPTPQDLQQFVRVARAASEDSTERIIFINR